MSTYCYYYYHFWIFDECAVSPASYLIRGEIGVGRERGLGNRAGGHMGDHRMTFLENVDAVFGPG